MTIQFKNTFNTIQNAINTQKLRRRISIIIPFKDVTFDMKIIKLIRVHINMIRFQINNIWNWYNFVLLWICENLGDSTKLLLFNFYTRYTYSKRNTRFVGKYAKGRKKRFRPYKVRLSVWTLWSRKLSKLQYWD